MVAVLRGNYTWHDLAATAEALIDHDFTSIEYTFNSPNAEQFIGRLASEYGGKLTVGAGTVLTPEQAIAAAAAGAQFLVTPGFSQQISETVRQLNVLLVPGVFSPSEVMQAAAAGWSLLKLFPASTGGISHLRALMGPFAHLQFLATGGVTQANAHEYLQAGAVAVGIGSSLFKPGMSRAELGSGLAELVAALNVGGPNAATHDKRAGARRGS